jgi:hypothetical protein
MYPVGGKSYRIFSVEFFRIRGWLSAKSWSWQVRRKAIAVHKSRPIVTPNRLETESQYHHKIDKLTKPVNSPSQELPGFLKKRDFGSS